MPEIGPRGRAEVAFVLDYASRWALAALPQGRNFNPSHHALDFYAALRRHGVDVDIIGPEADLTGYRLVVAPDLVIMPDRFIDRLESSGAKALFGPRAGSKTCDMHIPDGLPPGPLRRLIDLKVTRVESLPEWQIESAVMGNHRISMRRWRETVATGAEVLAWYDGDYRTGAPALVGNDRVRYLAGLPDAEGLNLVVTDALDWAGIAHIPDLGDIRLARRDGVTFAFNFGPKEVSAPVGASARFLLGNQTIGAFGVAAWMEPAKP